MFSGICSEAEVGSLHPVEDVGSMALKATAHECDGVGDR
jgi:hypothetical protein